MIRYELPFPPSVNNLFANVARGRVRTARYKQWSNDAGNLILMQGRKSIKGRVSLSVALVRPDARRRDLSNTLKSIEDLLVEMQVIEDDSLVQRISLQWVAAGAPCLVIIQQAEEAIAA